MAQRDRDVKSDPGHRQPLVVVVIDRCRCWIDRHPRTGWYVAALSVLNVILNLIQIFH